MSETTTSQVQQIQGAWRKAVEDQAARVEQAFGESARWEHQGMDQVKTAVDEWARLSKDTFAYFCQLSNEWRKLTLETTRKAAGMMAPEV